MKYEMPLLGGLFAACLLVCSLALSSMLSLSVQATKAARIAQASAACQAQAHSDPSPCSRSTV